MDFQKPSTRSETDQRCAEYEREAEEVHGLPRHEPNDVVDQRFDGGTPAGFGVGWQDLRRYANLRMIDLPAPVSRFGHDAQSDDCERQHEVKRSAGEAPKMPKPPQLDPGGDAGERKPEEAQQRHIAVSVDDGLGNPRNPGQRPHRSSAGDIGRNTQDGAYDKNDQARSRHDRILHEEPGNVEDEGEHEADGREVIQNDVDMRPGLRRSLRRRVQSEFVVIDLPADLSRDGHQDQTDDRKT